MQEHTEQSFDIAVYGSTISGIAAAIAASRLGCSVALISPDSHFGGMLTGGLSRTDIGKPKTVGGIFKEFMAAIEQHYRSRYGENSSQHRDCRSGVHFEPHVANEILDQWLADNPSIRVLQNSPLTNVHLKDGAIHSLDLQEATVNAKVFIDASYEGDLGALSGVPYRIGREGRTEHTEEFAGHIFWDSERAVPTPDGTGMPDKRVQAYCYRLCLTTDPKNLVLFDRPEGYTRDTYSLLERYIKEKDSLNLKDYVLPAAIPNQKFDVNNWGFCWQSMDLIEADDEYPDARAEKRLEIVRRHRDYQIGWWYFMQNDPVVPSALQKAARTFGLCRDEFRHIDHWSPQLYIREARRFYCKELFSEKSAKIDSKKPNSIGIGSYPLDSHATHWYHPGQNTPAPEGFFMTFTKPYDVPFDIMVPEKVSNLLISVCVNATHVGWGTLRMEPIFCALGQAAGIAGALKAKGAISWADGINQIQEKLKKQQQVF